MRTLTSGGNMNYYILKGKEFVLEPDLFKFGKWFRKADRHIKKDIINEITISTVFLGIDHNFGGGYPILFETMIFGGKHDQYQERYHTWEEAEIGHKKAVEMVKNEINS